MKTALRITDRFLSGGGVIVNGVLFSNVFSATAYLHEFVGFSEYEAFQYLELIGKEAADHAK